jgi:phytol kinase
MLENHFIALGLTFVIAILWLRLNDFFAHKGWVSSQISRKIIHIGTGPIFILCWLLFNESRLSPFLAALIPLGITLQFASVGLGILRDPAAVVALSRSGDRREILRGPLLYGIVFVLLTIVFWRNSPIGIVALMILCGGDGLADVVGMRVGGIRLPWSPKKTLIGSVSMLVGGFFLSMFILWVYLSHGYFHPPITQYILPVGLIALATTLVESLPFRDIDNLTVPLTAVILGTILF